MNIYKKKIKLETEKQADFIDITEEIKNVVKDSGFTNGQVLVFSPHSTASIAVNQNESLLIQDFTKTLYRIAPIDERYNHDSFELSRKKTSDGRSNGHSHCKNVMLGCSETLILSDGELVLGERQSVFFVELDGGRKRDYLIQILGE